MTTGILAFWRSGRRRALLPALAAGLLATFCAPVAAQLIVLDPDQAEPQEQGPAIEQPGDVTGAAPPMAPVLDDRGRAPRPDTPSPVIGPDEGERVLLPLRLAVPRADTPSAPRLSGEVARERFILFLPAATGASEIRIAHRSGIDVLPDRSQVEVAINGNPVGTFLPDSFETFALAQLEVPEGLLLPGPNIVEITARHTHRIACGPEAAFALWTDIDVTASGIMVPVDALDLGPLSFLAALSAQAARGDPVVIRRPDPSAPLDDAAPFIAQVVAALGGTLPSIESAAYWSASDGLPDLVRITAVEPGTDPDTPRFERGGDGAIVLLVERGRGYAEVRSMLVSAAGPVGATPHGPPVQPGTAVRLADLEAPVLQAEGRYSLMTVQFRLPADWLLLASQRAQLDLDYMIAPGLPAGSLMLLKVNGTTVRLLPLDRDVGVSLPTLPIRFNAALLRPGVNRLDFEVLVPGDPPNIACPRMSGPIVDIRPGSRLFVPDAPSMTMPSLDRALDALPTDGIRLTEAAVRQIPPGALPQIVTAISMGARNPVDGATLTVGTLADIDRIRAPLVSRAAGALVDALRRGPAMRDPAAPTGGADGAVVSEESVEPTAGGAVRTGNGSRLEDFAERLRTAPVRMLRGDTPDLVAWLEGRTAGAALLQPDPEDEHTIWLILGEAGDPTDVARALAASRESADGPTGQVALYVPGAGWQSWTAPDRPLRLFEAPRAQHLRAVMGWARGHRPAAFVGVLTGITALSALVAILILLTTRRGRI